jgi:hypothetical protein
MASLELIVVFVVSLLAIFFGLVVFIGAPYVPSQRKYVRRAFEHLGLGAKDVLVDIGSGDGVVLRIAASYGAKAVRNKPCLGCACQAFIAAQPTSRGKTAERLDDNAAG